MVGEVMHFSRGLKRIASGAALAFYAVDPVLASPHRLGGGDAAGVSIIRVIGTLFLCLLLAGAMIFLLKRAQLDTSEGLIGRLRQLLPAALPPGRIAVIESRRISPHADLCLLRAGEREYAVIVASAYATILSEQMASDRRDGDVL